MWCKVEKNIFNILGLLHRNNTLASKTSPEKKLYTNNMVDQLFSFFVSPELFL